ncbi:MAG TPA: hypothetical protein VGM38_10515 [Pseudolysinimonas sp.]
MTQPSPSSLPSENVQRGVIFALIALPAGVIAWDILWTFGFIASIVSFGIAYLAARLYRFGSGGRVSRSGAIAIAVITIGTLIIAFISGFAVQIVGLYSQQFGTSIPESLVAPRFWSIVFASMTSGSAILPILLALVFGALGCFSILSTAFRQTRVVQPTMDAAPTAADPSVPQPPAAPQGLILNGEPIPPTDEPLDKK